MGFDKLVVRDITVNIIPDGSALYTGRMIKSGTSGPKDFILFVIKSVQTKKN